MSPFYVHFARLGFLILVCGPCAVAAAAPIQAFDAVVQTAPGDEAVARSGPGIAHHYITSKLAPGERVHVLRKDPGGWYMIDPPPGSYSWILAAYVERLGSQQGKVTKNGVVVRVGAAHSTQRDIEQVRLNTGDVVDIIGEQVLESEKGRGLWLKIKPPRGEHRWVKGSHLVELNPDGSLKVVTRRSTHKPSEKASESSAVSESPAVAVVAPMQKKSDGPAILRDPGSEAPDAPAYGHAPGRRSSRDPFLEEGSGAPSGQSEDPAIREDLVLLDKELTQILVKPIKDWDFSTQREDLTALRALAEDPQLTAEIDRRVKKIDGLEQKHEDFVALLQPYAGRAIQSGTAGGAARQATKQGPVAGSIAGGASSPGRPSGSRFEGAGILHRLPQVAAGTPPYVIAAPDQRILCYLESERGLELDRYIGQSVGLNGPRKYDPRLRADRMLVQKITPVRLAR